MGSTEPTGALRGFSHDGFRRFVFLDFRSELTGSSPGFFDRRPLEIGDDRYRPFFSFFHPLYSRHITNPKKTSLAVEFRESDALKERRVTRFARDLIRL